MDNVVINKEKFKEDYFVLGQIMSNVMRSNPDTINYMRKQNNKPVLSDEEYKECEIRYKEVCSAYDSMLAYMVETYGDLEEAEKEYL